jgi:hypothetical protein
MSIYRGDFYLLTGPVIDVGKFPLRIESANQIEIVIRKSPIDGSGFSSGLLITVVTEARGAGDLPTLLEVLNQQLDVFAFVTRRAFQLSPMPLGIVAWDNFAKVRQYMWFQDRRAIRVVENLSEGFDAVARIAALSTSEYQKQALHAFRVALWSERAEDKFQAFWRAVEIIATNRKGNRKALRDCPKCHSTPLVCVDCGYKLASKPTANNICCEEA